MSESKPIRGVLARWWPVPALLVVGAVGGAAYGIATPAKYTVSAYVVATVAPSSATGAGTNDPQLAQQFAAAYARIIGQGEIMAPAAQKIGVTTDWLKSHVQSSSSPDAPVIQLTCTATNATDPTNACNAVAASLSTYATSHVGQTRVSLTVLSNAMPPDAPSTPSSSLDVAVGGVAGLLLGLLTVLSRKRPEGGGNSILTRPTPTASLIPAALRPPSTLAPLSPASAPPTPAVQTPVTTKTVTPSPSSKFSSATTISPTPFPTQAKVKAKADSEPEPEPKSDDEPRPKAGLKAQPTELEKAEAEALRLERLFAEQEG